MSALDAAKEELTDDDTLVVIAITKEDSVMKYWSANATNMQVNWMADNVKADIMFGSM